MKYLVLLVALSSFYLLSLTPAFAVSYNSSYVPTISCSNCNSGTCSCAATCSSGTLDIFTSSACNYIPSKETTFSGTFSISLASTKYAEIFCDDGGISSCTTISYFPSSSTTTTTSQSGYIPPCQALGRICTSISHCCSGLVCQNGMCVTQTTTTTSLAPIACPYICCSNDARYLDKGCGDGTACINHVCENTLTPTSTISESPQYPQISFSLVASVLVAILIIVALIYYVFGIVMNERSSKKILEKMKKERSTPSK